MAIRRCTARRSSNETRFPVRPREQSSESRGHQSHGECDRRFSLSAFSGGSGFGISNDLQDRYELQNYTSLIHGNHVLKFGGRFRATHDTSYLHWGIQRHLLILFTFRVPAGTITATLTSPPPACQGLPVATPQQLSFTQGSPNASVTYFDFEPYFQDDWRVRPNITFSVGLRFETQNAIHDHGDFAPRVGFAWGVGGRSSPPKVVIRGGYGIFYNRFQSGSILQAERLNGIVQQQFIVSNPTCFPGLEVPLTNFSNCGASASAASNVYQISPTLHAPYTMQGAVSVERQVTKSATVSATYLNSRGFDQFVTINASAPYPGTPCYASATGCPPIIGGNVYRYVSEGNFKQNQLILNTERKGRLQGPNSSASIRLATPTAILPALPVSRRILTTSARIGAAPRSMVRHRLFLGGSIAFPYLDPPESTSMVVSSGSPFNITLCPSIRTETLRSTQRSSGLRVIRDLSPAHQPARHHLLHSARNLRCVGSRKTSAHQL